MILSFMEKLSDNLKEEIIQISYTIKIKKHGIKKQINEDKNKNKFSE